MVKSFFTNWQGRLGVMLIATKYFLGLFIMATNIVDSGMVMAASPGSSRLPNSTGTLPTIVLKLGDHIDTVRANSTFDFSKKNYLKPDELASMIEEPHTFVFAHPTRGFTLPEATYLNIGLERTDRVQHMQVQPQLKFLNTDEAFALCQKLIDQFDAAGWKRDPSLEKVTGTLSEIRKSFARPEIHARRGNAVKDWRNGNEKLYIELRLVHRPGDPVTDSMGFKEDLYIVIVHIDKERTSEEWKKMVLDPKNAP